MASPTGGSHWSLVVGWDPNIQQFLMHDPYGEADLLAGGFTRTAIGSGKGVRYTLKTGEPADRPMARERAGG